MRPIGEQFLSSRRTLGSRKTHPGHPTIQKGIRCPQRKAESVEVAGEILSIAFNRLMFRPCSQFKAHRTSLVFFEEEKSPVLCGAGRNKSLFALDVEIAMKQLDPEASVHGSDRVMEKIDSNFVCVARYATCELGASLDLIMAIIRVAVFEFGFSQVGQGFGPLALCIDPLLVEVDFDGLAGLGR